MRPVHSPRSVTTEAKHAQAQARDFLAWWLWSITRGRRDVSKKRGSSGVRTIVGTKRGIPGGNGGVSTSSLTTITRKTSAPCRRLSPCLPNPMRCLFAQGDRYRLHMPLPEARREGEWEQGFQGAHGPHTIFLPSALRKREHGWINPPTHNCWDSVSVTYKGKQSGYFEDLKLQDFDSSEETYL